MLRRVRATPESQAAPDRVRIGDLTIDLGARRVAAAASDEELELTSAEFDLLQCFVTRPQRVLSRDQLLDWTRGAHRRRLRPYDRRPGEPAAAQARRLAMADCLKTVRNAGYILAAPVQPG